MLSSGYIIKIAKATEREIESGLYSYMANILLKSYERHFAYDLANVCTYILLCKTQLVRAFVEFRMQNEEKVDRELQKLCHDHQLCEILSRAAFNISSGRYAERASNIGENLFLMYIRTDYLADNPIMLSKVSTLEIQLPEGVLDPIIVLKKRGLWLSRTSNPCESEYFIDIREFNQCQSNNLSIRIHNLKEPLKISPIHSHLG